jgi:hypothetical protein
MRRSCPKRAADDLLVFIRCMGLRVQRIFSESRLPAHAEKGSTLMFSVLDVKKLGEEAGQIESILDRLNTSTIVDSLNPDAQIVHLARVVKKLCNCVAEVRQSLGETV